MIAKLAAESCEIPPAEINQSIEHLVYRMIVLTNEENPLDSIDRKAISRLWLLKLKLAENSGC
jgi:hypothetical protein